MNADAPPSDLVLVARFGAAHGVRGEIRIKAYTADPLAIFDYSPLYARDGRKFTILAVRPAGEVIVARVKELTSRNHAEAVTNLDLFASRALFPPPEDEDEFFHEDLIGLKVETVDGEPIGEVVALHDFGAGAMLDVARPRSKSVLIPFTKAVVPVVDVRTGRIVVAPPDRLLDDDAPDGA